MRYFPHILRTVRMGRTRVLPIRPVLRDARNLPAPIVSVIIGLPLPVFATACILLPAACPPLCRSSRSACSACSAAPASQPARRLLCLLCLLCRSAALPLCLLQSACLQKKRDFEKSRFFIIRFGPSSAPPDFLRVSPENLPGRAARGSWPNRPRDVSLRR